MLMNCIIKITIILSLTTQQILSATVRPGTTSAYHPRGDINITRPGQSETDDLLFLFLSRTDEALPVKLNGWTAVASCLKKHNNVNRCETIDNCRSEFLWRGYCYSGADLGTVVYFRKITDYEPSYYHMNITAYYGRPAWAILTAVKNADISSENPVRSVATTSCDKSDSSIFPSVYGKEGDLLLLSMAFDDYASMQEFQAPTGTTMEKYVSGHDEAGFLYSKELNSVGETGVRVTRGSGNDYCKDVLISLVVRRRIKSEPVHRRVRRGV